MHKLGTVPGVAVAWVGSIKVKGTLSFRVMGSITQMKRCFSLPETILLLLLLASGWLLAPPRPWLPPATSAADSGGLVRAALVAVECCGWVAMMGKRQRVLIGLGVCDC
jgi:hypothetical protein